jgi:hypothetical protein
MALQIRRGPTIDRLGDGSPQNPGRYFAEGELVYDTTDKEVYIGDGPPGTVGGGTLGGKPITTFTADQAKDAAGATLTDNGLHSNISFTYNSSTKKLSAVVALDGTYNDLVQDTTPELGGNLLLNGNNIIGSGDIAITGDISATTFNGNVIGQTSDISNHVTDDLAEGSTNRYYLDSRARAAISVSSSGGGTLAYSSTTGIINYTGPSDSDYRAAFSGGTGVSIASGVVSIGQAVGTTSSVTFNSVNASTFTGDLTGNVTGNVSGSAGSITNGVYTVGDQTINGVKTFTSSIISNLTGNVTGDVSGNAGTVTDGVYTTGSYTNPSWIVSIPGTKITGDITANIVGNINGVVTGTAGSALFGSVSTDTGTIVVNGTTGNVVTPSISVTTIESNPSGSADPNISFFVNHLSSSKFAESVDFSKNVFFGSNYQTLFISGHQITTGSLVAADSSINRTIFATPVQFGRYTVAERDQLRNRVPVATAQEVRDEIVLPTKANPSTITTSTITLDIPLQPYAPFSVGDSITITGVTPVEYNVTATVTACTTSTVSFANSTPLQTGEVTVAGEIIGPVTDGTVIYCTNSGGGSTPQFLGRIGGSWVSLS